MTEGELWIKIREEIKYGKINNISYIGTLSKIRQFIDEAKQDFPKYPATQFKFKWSKLFKKKQAEQIVKIIEEAQKPYKEWGKRWLGDSS